MKNKTHPKSKRETEHNGKNSRDDFLIVGIGASAGGIKALKEFFEKIPADSGMAYVVILHLSPDYESKLAEILQTNANIPVKQIKKREKVKPDCIYVIPPDKSLTMIDGYLLLSEIERIEERRAPVDIFFRTLAESHESRAVAVILSGTGSNGSMGIKRVKERGGICIVQNPREADYSDMPRNSIATGLVDYVLPVAEIPAKILGYRQNLKLVQIPIEPLERAEQDEQSLREIFTLLRVRTKHDFTNYKRATTLRRLERRINVHELEDLPSYAKFMREHTSETTALLRDLLISVTNFFRDCEVFENLEKEIIPKIFEGKKSGDQVRVWTAGCATGEEAYSLAMLLNDFVDGSIDAPKLQVFATDIDENAIAVAREGFYTNSDIADVSPERLSRYFVKEKTGYRIRRELREMVLFASHNVIKDPPFSRLDLISCRNLLIYLNRLAQKRLQEVFHFALKPGGYLFLGSSESVTETNNFYMPVDKLHNIYQSRAVETRLPMPLSDSLYIPRIGESVKEERIQENRAVERLSYLDIHQRLLEQYAPPSVVINEEYDLVHFSETAGRFMYIAAGEPSLNLLKMIHPELRLELRTALYQAVQQRKNIETNLISLNVNDHSETIRILVRPVLRSTEATRGLILVIFEEISKTAKITDRETVGDLEPLTQKLEDELVYVKAQLRSTVEQYEVQNEELKASNEELQAINEELHSAAEELETGKEELQSVNEELTTVNQELKIKIEELSQANNDFQNLMSSTDIGTVFLDRTLRVKLFTPRACDVFNLIPADIDRPLSDITSKIKDADLLEDIEKVLAKLQSVEREIETGEGRWYLMKILPYRTKEDHIEGVILTFIEITQRINHEQKLRQMTAQLEQQTRLFNAMLSGITDFTYIFDREGRFIYSNQALLDLLGITLEEITGKNFFELPYPKDLAAKLHQQIEQVFETKETIKNETHFESPTGKSGFYEYIFSPSIAADGSVEFVVGSTRDVTERKEAEESIRFQAHLLNTVEQSVIATNLEGIIIYWNDFAKKMYGWSENEAIGRNIMGLTIPAESNDTAVEIMAQLNQKKSWSGEFQVQRSDGSSFPAQIFNSPINDRDGNIIGIVGFSNDISSRKESDERLRLSEERLKLLIESATDYAIFTIKNDSSIDGWNSGAERIFGYSEDEIIGKNVEILFTPEDRERGIPEKEMEKAVENGRSEDERWHLRKDGSKFFASGVMTQLGDNNKRGFVKIARDQTQKMQTESALHDKEMLQKLVGALEDERRRIARDLHDHLGQQLTVLRLKLEFIKKMCGDVEPLCGLIDETQKVAGHIDSDIDFLAFELRPASLNDLGLKITLANFVKEWSRHTKVPAEFHTSILSKSRLANEIEINLYRIAQEALNNTYKYAEAENVSVILEKQKDTLVLIIEDDGVGFDPENKKNESNGLGLIGIRERAGICGGTAEIEAAPGEGTTIYIRVPLRYEKK